MLLLRDALDDLPVEEVLPVRPDGPDNRDLSGVHGPLHSPRAHVKDLGDGRGGDEIPVPVVCHGSTIGRPADGRDTRPACRTGDNPVSPDSTDNYASPDSGARIRAMTSLPLPVRNWSLPDRVDWCLRQSDARGLLIDLVRSEKQRTAEVASGLFLCTRRAAVER